MMVRESDAEQSDPMESRTGPRGNIPALLWFSALLGWIQDAMKRFWNVLRRAAMYDVGCLAA